MQKTNNYQLNQWEPADKISREDFNRDNAAIDAALAANAQALSVYQTANDAAVAAMQQNVTNQGTNLTALAADLGSGGKNARIAWGTYTGTGTYSSAEPASLTFDFYPVLMLMGSSTTVESAYNPAVFLRGRCYTHADIDPNYLNPPATSVTWSDNGVSWYCSAGAEESINVADRVYYYVAIGCDRSTLTA